MGKKYKSLPLSILHRLAPGIEKSLPFQQLSDGKILPKNFKSVWSQAVKKGASLLERLILVLTKGKTLFF